MGGSPWDERVGRSSRQSQSYSVPRKFFSFFFSLKRGCKYCNTTHAIVFLKHFSVHSQRQVEKTRFTKLPCNAATNPLKTAACATERCVITLKNRRAKEWEDHGRRDGYFYGSEERGHSERASLFLRGFHGSNLMEHIALRLWTSFCVFQDSPFCNYNTNNTKTSMTE